MKVMEGKDLLVSDLLTGTSDPVAFLWVGSCEEGEVDLQKDKRVQVRYDFPRTGMFIAVYQSCLIVPELVCEVLADCMPRIVLFIIKLGGWLLLSIAVLQYRNRQGPVFFLVRFSDVLGTNKYCGWDNSTHCCCCHRSRD